MTENVELTLDEIRACTSWCWPADDSESYYWFVEHLPHGYTLSSRPMLFCRQLSETPFFKITNWRNFNDPRTQKVTAWLQTQFHGCSFVEYDMSWCLQVSPEDEAMLKLMFVG